MVRRTISDYLGENPEQPPGDLGKGPSRALVPAKAPDGPDGTAALAAELNDLTRTLDVLATLAASVSDRVDAQTDALVRLQGTASEARQAAFAARAQSDPGRMDEERNAYGRLQGQAMDLARDLRRLARQQAALWRARLPGIGAAALLLVLALLILTPRFAADHPATCRLMSAEWSDYAAWGDGTRCEFERR